ncbi:MFS transporter [Marinobacterium zhoushanense]|uniref:MFS transporter n=1 Tax=Marinobacterium zhoushanense TaxID=1679163 RepID=A0ABQ1K0J0_9GAMM|nr:MFS transporter [Marinobacterium zhoushanense]GGB81320.1 MFS transporter [Marinobacterium zhoushanense]
MITIDSIRGRTALCVAHVAGMIDMIALPVWVGALISQYHFTPQKAGGLATLFLMGVVVASLFWSPRFNRFKPRLLVPLGFCLTSIAFFVATTTDHYILLAILHACGGLTTGMSLSFTHGSIGRASNPHKLFGLAQFSLGSFAILFLGGSPTIIETFGGPALFVIFGSVMALAAIMTLLLFPHIDNRKAKTPTHQVARERIPRQVWFGIFGVSLMAILQAMTFSFVERVGSDMHGYSTAQVSGVLLATGLVGMLPGLAAMLMHGRWSAPKVMLAGPALQAALTLVIVMTTAFPAYAIAVCFYPFIMVFTHTFAFGYFADKDPSGRAVAATPAMNMIGSGIGPFLGGTLVQFFGYESLGYGALVLALLAILSVSQLGREVGLVQAAR